MMHAVALSAALAIVLSLSLMVACCPMLGWAGLQEIPFGFLTKTGAGNTPQLRGASIIFLCGSLPLQFVIAVVLVSRRSIWHCVRAGLRSAPPSKTLVAHPFSTIGPASKHEVRKQSESVERPRSHVPRGGLAFICRDIESLADRAGPALGEALISAELTRATSESSDAEVLRGAAWRPVRWPIDAFAPCVGSSWRRRGCEA